MAIKIQKGGIQVLSTSLQKTLKNIILKFAELRVELFVDFPKYVDFFDCFVNSSEMELDSYSSIFVWVVKYDST